LAAISPHGKSRETIYGASIRAAAERAAEARMRGLNGVIEQAYWKNIGDALSMSLVIENGLKVTLPAPIEPAETMSSCSSLISAISSIGSVRFCVVILPPLLEGLL
jgi:hypothetical protein